MFNLLDNTQQSSSQSHQLFAMSGDQNNDVKIPAVFLFYKEGKILIEAMQDSNNQLEILMGARAVNSKFTH